MSYGASLTNAVVHFSPNYTLCGGGGDMQFGKFQC